MNKLWIWDKKNKAEVCGGEACLCMNWNLIDVKIKDKEVLKKRADQNC